MKRQHEPVICPLCKQPMDLTVLKETGRCSVCAAETEAMLEWADGMYKAIRERMEEVFRVFAERFTPVMEQFQETWAEIQKQPGFEEWWKDYMERHPEADDEAK